MIRTSTPQRESAQTGRFSAKCPYFDGFDTVCRASLSALPVDRRRSSVYCACEDHDDCAIYMAKVLRLHRPVAFSLQARELEVK